MAKQSKRKKQPSSTKQKTNKASKLSTSAPSGLLLLSVLLLTTVAFIPSLFNDFVTWDDDVNILKNPNLQVFDWPSIKGIFTDTVIGNYNPLSIFTLAIEKALFGLNATVMHVNNLLLHLITVFFVFKVSRSLQLSPLSAAFVALLFGIHPMRVESVAWVTERKDVLFGTFYFAALFHYIRYVQSDKKDSFRLWFIVPLFLLSLLSKIQAVALPLSMLAVDYYLKRPLNFQLLLEKVPYFLLSLTFGLAGIFFLSKEGSLDQATDYTFFERLIVGAYTYIVYLAKAIFPYRMSPLYPYPSVIGSHFYLIAGLLIPLVVGLYFLYKKQQTALLFGIAFFTVNVVFMLQVLGAGQGFLADRFTYVPYFGLFFAAGYYFQKILSTNKNSMPVKVGLAGYCLVFMVMTWQQNGIWENGETLWTHVLKYYDGIDTPFTNRAQYYRDIGNIDSALADYNRAIEVKPDKGNNYNSRGKTYFDLGAPKNDRNLVQRAIDDYTKGISFSPELGELYANRGAAFGFMGNGQAALADLNKAIELAPEEKGGYANRSLLYMQNGQYDLAIQDHTTYLTLNPYDADVWYERGLAKSRLGQHQAAITDYNEALRFKQRNGIFYMQRGLAYKNIGNKQQAAADLRQAQGLGTTVPASYWNGLQ
ncbi:MAG: tetratricopeptide repeat protein [Bacteroidota bacterium]